MDIIDEIRNDFVEQVLDEPTIAGFSSEKKGIISQLLM